MSETPPPSPSAPASRSVMNRIVAASLRQPLLIALLTLVLVAAGLWSFSRLSVDA